jgi:phage tail-like protein
MPPANKDYYPPSGFYFRVQTVDASGQAIAGGAKLDMAFQDASGLSVEMEPETLAEGGLNTYKHRLPVTPKYSDLVLKRGFVTQSLPLYQWCKATIQAGFSKPIQPKTLAVQLLAPGTGTSDPTILRQWTFFGAWPSKWNVSDFSSMKNEVVVETLQFVYRYFTSN